MSNVFCSKYFGYRRGYYPFSVWIGFALLPFTDAIKNIATILSI